MNPPTIHTDLEALSRATAQACVDLIRRCQQDRGTAHIALAGGGTPKRLYQVLAEPEFRARIDWNRVHLYFGDERAVPPDHPDSNFYMARAALLDKAPIPEQQVHPIYADMPTIRQDAARYCRELQQWVPTGEDRMPQLDLVLLGVGDDGHTASLFPRTCILRERHRAAAAVYVPRLKSWRISLTYPVLEAARALWVLASGTSKTAILQRIWQEPEAHLPIQALGPLPQLHWHLDQAAAQGLDHD